MMWTVIFEQELCESVLNSNCDNDDYHPAVTPLVLAAQRNNFNTVQVPKVLQMVFQRVITL